MTTNQSEYVYLIIFVQIVQLPVIALIILFSQSIRWKRKNNNTIQNPLGFIAIGFFFNFIYILYHIVLSYSEHVNKITALTSNEIEKDKIILDIITSYFFLKESWKIFKLNRKRFYSYVPEVLTFIIFISTYLNNSFTDSNLNIILFDCVVYLMVCLYFYNKRREEKNSNRGIFINNYIFWGFMIWASLQFLVVLSIPFNFQIIFFDLTGFTCSTFCKILILYGLYNYSLNLESSLNTTIENQNNKLQSLQTIINQISNSEDIETFEKNVCKHLTNDEDNNVVFNFEYAILSGVDYLENKIIYRDSLSPKNTLIDSPAQWVVTTGIPFESVDVLSVVKKELAVYWINGNLINGKKIDVNKDNSILNRSVYNKYNHKNLNRLIFPIKTTDSKEKAIAIIEVGYHKLSANGDLHALLDSEFKLYRDNLCQTYEKLLFKKLANEIIKSKNKAITQSGDNHRKFLQMIMSDFLEISKSNYCLLYTRRQNLEVSELIEKNLILPDEHPLNKKINHLLSILKRFNLNQQVQSQKIDSLKKALKILYGFENILIKQIETEQNENNFFIAMKTDNNMFFDEPDTFFNLYDIEEIKKTYKEKKFHYYLAQLTESYSSLTDLDVNIRPMIKIIIEYFGANNVSLMERDYENNYIFKFSTLDIFQNINKTVAIDDSSLETIRLVNFEDFEIVDTLFFNQFKKKSEFLLSVPLRILDKPQGFLLLEFEKIPYLSNEDLNFLSLISNKFTSTLQIHKIIEAYNTIYDSVIKKDLKETLQTITDKALQILNADPVILFETRDGINVYFEDVTYSYSDEFKNHKILEIFDNKRKKNVELAELIIQTETNYFNDYKEYVDFIKEHSKKHEKIDFEEDFWIREKIASLAAIKLTSKISQEKPIGVLFINFRRPVRFTDDTQKLIESLAALTSIAMTNMVILDKNEKYLLDNMRLSKPIIENFLSVGLLHNAAKSNSSINLLAKQIIDYTTKLKDPISKSKLIPLNNKVEILKNLNTELELQFQELQSVYNPKKTIFTENVNIVALIKNVFNIISSEFQSKLIRKNFPDENKTVLIECDESQIEMSIKNIIKNAFEAMDSRDELGIEIFESRDSIKVTITDNGKKIKDDEISEIFKIYWTNKVNGSGLGLPISKYFIEKNHGGKLLFKQTEKMKTFTIILPKNK